MEIMQLPFDLSTHSFRDIDMMARDIPEPEYTERRLYMCCPRTGRDVTPIAFLVYTGPDDTHEVVIEARHNPRLYMTLMAVAHVPGYDASDYDKDLYDAVEGEGHWEHWPEDDARLVDLDVSGVTVIWWTPINV
jgi:hypothetical protein